MITAFAGVAETRLYETAIRLRALWGFERCGKARAGKARRRDVRRFESHIDVVAHQAGFGRVQASLQSPSARLRGEMRLMPTCAFVSAEANCDEIEPGGSRMMADGDHDVSALHAGRGRECDPSKLSTSFIRPPQQGHGGGSIGEADSLSVCFRSGRSRPTCGVLSNRRHSASLSAR